MSNVGIVIVSHSAKVAEGAADMVRQMVGTEVPLAWCGGNPEGGLGTSVAAIMGAVDKAWSDKGVAILGRLDIKLYPMTERNGSAKRRPTIFNDPATMESAMGKGLARQKLDPLCRRRRRDQRIKRT